MLIVQADVFNRSRISTVLGVILTSNLRLVDGPGNVLVPAKRTGLARDSVANVSQLVTVDRADLDQRIGRASSGVRASIDNGLKLVLGLL